jgi:hypothetical protein
VKENPYDCKDREIDEDGYEKLAKFFDNGGGCPPELIRSSPVVAERSVFD